MKRYTPYVVPVSGTDMIPNDDGRYVLFADAEAEIEKARKANVESYENGYKQGLRNGSVLIHDTQEENDRIRADERERIVRICEGVLRGWYEGSSAHAALTHLIEKIEKSSKPQEPKPLVRLDENSFMAPDGRALAGAVNVLSIAIERIQSSLREKGIL
jgi:hypothetical protein